MQFMQVLHADKKHWKRLFTIDFSDNFCHVPLPYLYSKLEVGKGKCQYFSDAFPGPTK